MYLSGTGTNDPRWLEKIVQHPPTSLATLEYWVGQLDVDFAGGEGRGYVHRPDPAKPGRGALRPEVTRLGAHFRWDMHHQRHEQPRDMALASVSLALDLGHATVAQLLAQEYGPGRPVATAHGPVVEYGRYFYLHATRNGTAALAFETQQPEWAIPKAPAGAVGTLLHTLHDRLICDREVAPLLAALAAPAQAAGAELRDWNGNVALAFRPPIALAEVVAALRWEHPVASSGDVHMSAWSVSPEHAPPRINGWFVDVQLAGWPRGEGGAELPRVGRAGPSSVYDVRACATRVSSISVRPERS